MRRFILERNIERFEKALNDETDPTERRVIGDLLAGARRELAELDDDQQPLQRPPSPRGPEK